jgi:hypothetical protein
MNVQQAGGKHGEHVIKNKVTVEGVHIAERGDTLRKMKGQALDPYFTLQR